MNGIVTEFVKVNTDAHPLELVCFSFKILTSSHVDNRVVTVAAGHHEGIGLYARSRNSPWGSQGGTCSNPAVTHSLTYPIPSPTSWSTTTAVRV